MRRSDTISELYKVTLAVTSFGVCAVGQCFSNSESPLASTQFFRVEPQPFVSKEEPIRKA